MFFYNYTSAKNEIFWICTSCFSIHDKNHGKSLFLYKKVVQISDKRYTSYFKKAVRKLCILYQLMTQTILIRIHYYKNNYVWKKIILLILIINSRKKIRLLIAKERAATGNYFYF